MAHTIRTCSRFSVLGACLVLGGANPAAMLRAGQGQDHEPQYRSNVDLVQLQVRVESDDGSFRAGLQAADFELLVNGEPRDAAIAYEVNLLAEPIAADVPATGPPSPGAGRPLAARRHFLFLFDVRYTTRRGVRESQRAATVFFEEHVRQSDVTALATIDRFGAKLLIPFTDNWRAVKARVDQVSLKAATDATEGQSVAPENFAEAEAEVAQYLLALDWLAEVLRAVDGRKHLVLFSAGLPDEVTVGAGLEHLSKQAEARASGSVFGYVERGDPAYLSGSPDARRGLEAAVDALQKADVVVHSVDSRGLRFDPANGRQSLLYIASGTGGDAYWNMNDLEVALRQIDNETNRFYLLAYEKQAGDPDTVELEVSVGGNPVASAPTVLRTPPTEEDMTPHQKWIRQRLGT